MKLTVKVTPKETVPTQVKLGALPTVLLYKHHRDKVPFYTRNFQDASMAVYWIERMCAIYKCYYDIKHLAA